MRGGVVKGLAGFLRPAVGEVAAGDASNSPAARRAAARASGSPVPPGGGRVAVPAAVGPLPAHQRLGQQFRPEIAGEPEPGAHRHCVPLLGGMAAHQPPSRHDAGAVSRPVSQPSTVPAARTARGSLAGMPIYTTETSRQCAPAHLRYGWTPNPPPGPGPTAAPAPSHRRGSRRRAQCPRRAGPASPAAGQRVRPTRAASRPRHRSCRPSFSPSDHGASSARTRSRRPGTRHDSGTAATPGPACQRQHSTCPGKQGAPPVPGAALGGERPPAGPLGHLRIRAFLPLAGHPSSIVGHLGTVEHGHRHLKRCLHSRPREGQ